MKLIKEERILTNGFNQFNLVDENNLIVGVVAGFSNEQNFKNAVLLENAPKMLSILKEIMEAYNENGQLLSFNLNSIREVIEEINDQ